MAVRRAHRWLEASASPFKPRDFTNSAGFKGRQSNSEWIHLFDCQVNVKNQPKAGYSEVPYV